MNLSTNDDTNKTNYYNDEPHVHTIDDFLDYDTCLHFIQIASGKLKQALVSHGQKGEVSQGRTGKNCWISHSHDDITLNVATKIANHVGLPFPLPSFVSRSWHASALPQKATCGEICTYIIYDL